MLTLTDATKKHSFYFRYDGDSDTSRISHSQQYLTFTDRVTYLQWVKDWKETYKHLSKTIRYEKMSRKTVKPTAKWYTKEEYMALLATYSYKDTYGGMYYADLSSLARFLLVLRNQGKGKSQSLKLASQAASQAQPETV